MTDKIPTITVDMDKLCAECGQGGAVDNGLCMACTTKAIAGEKMASKTGKAVQQRFHGKVAEFRAPAGDLSHDTSNSKGAPVAKSGFAKDALKSFVNRVERLNEERDALSADIREVYAELKGSGFDSKIVRQVVRLRKLDRADFQEQEAILSLYLDAMGMR
jgi:uncharacterized protein (UPF0335 family)